MISVFFSYSHRDEDYRNELEIHLAPLKREGLISTWHDRRITPGDDFSGIISDQIECADIILLLVSAYFLSSDYCHDIEMKRAMERHENGNARVIPVILRPCDWNSAPFGKLLAVPTDGKPVSKHADVHDAFLDVVKAIRSVAASTSQTVNQAAVPKPTPLAAVPSSKPRSSNLRVMMGFSDHERAKFRNETFEYMANYFEASLEELEMRNTDLEYVFRRIDANTFTAHIYVQGNEKTACTLMLNSHFGDIAYSIGDRGFSNSCNEWMSIEHDGHMPLLRPGGMSMRRGSEGGLTQHGAAEYFWSMLIEPLQTR